MNARSEHTTRKTCLRLKTAGATALIAAAKKGECLTSAVDFNLDTASGSIIANITCCARETADDALNVIQQVLCSPYAFSNRFAVVGGGSRIGNFAVPAGATAICTVCSMTLSGLFRNRGIHAMPKFGGVVAVDKGMPKKFSAFLSSGEALLAPLDDFLNGAMTSVCKTLQTGIGDVLAGFLEIPEACVQPAKIIYDQLKRAGMGTKIMFGIPSQPLLGMPVSIGCAGMVVFRDINTVAALNESGIRMVSPPAKTLYRFENMLIAHPEHAAKTALQ